jgi:hypothetical protein
MKALRRFLQVRLQDILLAFFVMASAARGIGQIYPLPGQTPAQTVRVEHMLTLYGSRTGRWESQTKWMGRDSLYSISQVGPRGARAQQILEIFKHAAFLNPPQGFEVQVELMGVGQSPFDFHRDDLAATGPHPAAFRMGFNLFPGSAKQAGETGIHIMLDVNFIPPTSNPGHSTGTQALKPVVTDANGPILRGPEGGWRQIGAFHGFPLYRDGLIVLTRNRQPLYVPVSREDYLRAMIDDYAAKSGTVGSGYSPQFVIPLKAALGAMSPAERALPAWIGCRGPAGLCTSNDPLLDAATPLQRVNREFFDPQLSVDSVQLISIRVAKNLDPYAQYIFQHIWDTLDWDALGKMLGN